MILESVKLLVSNNHHIDQEVLKQVKTHLAISKLPWGGKARWWRDHFRVCNDYVIYHDTG